MFFISVLSDTLLCDSSIVCFKDLPTETKRQLSFSEKEILSGEVSFSQLALIYHDSMANY